MIREFNFFHGFTNNFTLVHMDHVETQFPLAEPADELIDMLSQEISNSIDEEIISELTRRINGGENIRYMTNNVNVEYLERYINMGGNRA